MNITLVKGMALLEALAHSDRPLGVTEIAVRLAIGKSNAHRILRSLVELGYVRQDASSGLYAASIRLWELGSAVMSNLDLKRLAEPTMQQMLERTLENVHLSMLDGDEVVYVHKLDSPHPVRSFSRIGGRAPAYAAATGKVILAYQGDAHLRALSCRLVRHTAATIVEPEAFLAEMAKIRKQGHAISHGEWRDGVRGVAVPIRDALGQAIAALGLSGPAERIRPAMFKSLVAQLAEGAHAIERELGQRDA